MSHANPVQETRANAAADEMGACVWRMLRDWFVCVGKVEFSPRLSCLPATFLFSLFFLLMMNLSFFFKSDGVDPPPAAAANLNSQVGFAAFRGLLDTMTPLKVRP